MDGDNDGDFRKVTTPSTSYNDDYYYNYSSNPCDIFPYEYVDFTQLSVVRYTFVSLYIIVIVLSLLGNVMVIWTVLRHRQMRTVTNCYIVNLATSDTLVSLLVMPLKMLEYTTPCEWHVTFAAADTLCSLLAFAMPVFVFVSVLTLIAISVERYYVIVHPINAKIFTSKGRTLRIIAAIWIIAIVVALPYLFCKSYRFSIRSHLGSVSRHICTDSFDVIDAWLFTSGRQESTLATTVTSDWEAEAATPPSGRFRTGFFMFLFLGMYIIPSAIILFTCVRIALCLWRPVAEFEHTSAQYRAEENKRKIAKMVIVVALTFLLSWSPFYLVNLITQFQESSFLLRSNFLFTMLATHLVGFTNSSVNPIVYTVLGDRFRSSFKSIIASVCCCCLSRKRRALWREDTSGQTGGLNNVQTSTTGVLYGCGGGRNGGGGDDGRGRKVLRPEKCIETRVKETG